MEGALIIASKGLFEDALRETLARRGLRAATVSFDEDVVQVARDRQPEIVFVDLDRDHRVGVRAGRMVLEACPHTVVLGLMATPDPAVIEASLKAGYAGCLTKDLTLPSFVMAIRQAMGGRSLLRDEVTELTLSSAGEPSWPSVRRAPERPPADPHARLLASQLTPRELEVLALLVEGAGGRATARRLHISTNTVRKHVQSVLEKLQVHSRLEAAAFAVQHGLVEMPMGPRTSDRSA